MGILIILLAGLAAGVLAGRFTKGSGFGIAGDVVVGLVGSLISAGVLGLFGLSTSRNLLYDVVVAFIVALVLIWTIGLLSGANRPLRHRKKPTTI